MISEYDNTSRRDSYRFNSAAALTLIVMIITAKMRVITEKARAAFQLLSNSIESGPKKKG